MDLLQPIAVIALIASSNVTDPEAARNRVLEGGELALEAVKQCIKDERNMNDGFELQAYIEDTGYFTVNCQTIDTVHGVYDAAKGEFIPTPMLKVLTDLFKEARKHENEK